MIIKKQYQSVSEFQADTDGAGRCLAQYNEDKKARARFMGAPVEDVTGPLRAGWADGVAQARKMAAGVELAPVRSGRMVRRWVDDSQDGLDWDKERAMYEMAPVLQRRPEKAFGVARGVRSFVVNIGEHCQIAASSCIWKALSVGAAVDSLESVGVRCEIWAAKGTDCHNGEYHYLSYRIKAASDPLNLGALCSAVAPWALRWWFFCWQDKHGRHVPNHRGSCLKMADIVSQFDFPGDLGGVIDTGRCLSESQAAAWVRESCGGAL